MRSVLRKLVVLLLTTSSFVQAQHHHHESQPLKPVELLVESLLGDCDSPGFPGRRVTKSCVRHTGSLEAQ